MGRGRGGPNWRNSAWGWYWVLVTTGWSSSGQEVGVGGGGGGGGGPSCRITVVFGVQVWKAGRDGGGTAALEGDKEDLGKGYTTGSEPVWVSTASCIRKMASSGDHRAERTPVQRWAFDWRC